MAKKNAAKQLIKWIADGVHEGKLGAWCIAPTSKRGVGNVLSILWEPTFKVFWKENPDCTYSNEEMLAALEMLTPQEFQPVYKEGNRCRFTSEKIWKAHVKRRKKGEACILTYQENLHCHQYPLEMFGLEMEDFHLWKKVKREKVEKAFMPAPMIKKTKRTGDMYTVPLNVGAVQYEMIQEEAIDMIVPSQMRYRLEEMLDNDDIPEVIYPNNYFGDKPVRLNISLNIAHVNQIRQIANENHVDSASVIRQLLFPAHYPPVPEALMTA